MTNYLDPLVIAGSVQNGLKPHILVSAESRFSVRREVGIEYENAQKGILEVFGQWQAPANFKIEFFVIRVGEWGGHMLVDCDDPLTIHKFCSMLPAFVFQVHLVVRVEEAVLAGKRQPI